ncbi:MULTISPECIES: hypothetical protein [Streptomyces]|uniref:Uncharacterized protein n=1 Tax=Streptomyces doudnae TaxID=3075536 RepID=A0ABD5EWI0_9ACTN|nr:MULTISPECIES: hypothetical protein [unclassified Streptomyces]MDT0438675.1 hypothetical protein [Streptomyces sp. DSM 41981]SCD28648.1 hypothetical protein GA0115242_10075 [Streptomyces sp. SolWspMP-5a-2]
MDYAALLRAGATVVVEESPGVELRRRKQPWHRAAPYAAGASYLPFTAELPFGLWVFHLVPGEDETRAGRTWHQRICFRVPAWWALGPQGRTAAALVSRVEQATWQDVLALRRSYEKAWPTDREDSAWYDARDLAADRDRGLLKNVLIKHTEQALSRTAQRHGKRVRGFSDEQKSVTFAAVALAIADLSPDLAQRLLGPLRLALGDVHTWSVPLWATTVGT